MSSHKSWKDAKNFRAEAKPLKENLIFAIFLTLWFYDVHFFTHITVSLYADFKEEEKI
jgi:hypothetical protein